MKTPSTPPSPERGTELDQEDKARIDEMLAELNPAERAYAVECLAAHEEPDGDEPIAVKTKEGEIPLDPKAMFQMDDDERESY